MTVQKPQFVHYVAGPGVLEGPYSELKIGEITIEIYTRRNAKHMINPKVHGIRAREAAEQRPPHAPNPALVPLDWENEDMPGGPFVFAKIIDFGHPFGQRIV